MTVLTRPVQPGLDASAERGQVPWQAMLWVTWRQHRGLLIIVPAVFGAAVAFMLTILAFAASQLFTWFFAPFLAQQNLTVLTPPVFETRGLAYAAWTLTAFCLGAFLGTLMRRILPAMAATLGVYVALGAATWFYLRDHYPVSTFWPMQLFEAGWLLVLSALLIAGTVWLVRRHAT